MAASTNGSRSSGFGRHPVAFQMSFVLAQLQDAGRAHTETHPEVIPAREKEFCRCVITKSRKMSVPLANDKTL